jgi:hypothetical protein
VIKLQEADKKKAENLRAGKSVFPPCLQPVLNAAPFSLFYFAQSGLVPPAMKWLSRLLLVLFLSGVTGPLFALILFPLPLEKLTQKADLVLQGTIQSLTVKRDPAGRIYTEVDLEPAEIWKGALPSNGLKIVHGGGTLGERRQIISGQVEFRVGEEVVLFLIFNQRQEALTIGLAQGKFEIFEEETGEKLARNPFHGNAPGASGKHESTSRTTGPLTLAQLRQIVTQSLE